MNDTLIVTTQMDAVNVPQRFTKRPVTIEAIQWDGTAQTLDDLTAWSRQHTLPGGIIPIPNADRDNRLIIHTLEGTMRGDVGDWVIKGVNGEFYACKPDIFEATYQPADDHVEGEQADPTDAEIEAAALEFEEHEEFWYGDDDQPRCECGFMLEEALNGSPMPSLQMHQARAALVAAREVTSHE